MSSLSSLENSDFKWLRQAQNVMVVERGQGTQKIVVAEIFLPENKRQMWKVLRQE